MIVESKPCWGKIQMIKILRKMTNPPLGLVDAKIAVERWLEATGRETVEDLKGAWLFVSYCSMFAAEKIVMQEYKVVWNKPNDITNDEIAAFGAD